MRVVEGISGIETAASLGVHETTVRTRLYRALRRLDAEVTRRSRMHEKVMELQVRPQTGWRRRSSRACPAGPPLNPSSA